MTNDSPSSRQAAESEPTYGVWHQRCPKCGENRLSPNVNPGELYCDECGHHVTVARYVPASGEREGEGTERTRLDLGEHETFLSVEQEENRQIVGSLQVLENFTDTMEHKRHHAAQIRRIFERLRATIAAKNAEIMRLRASSAPPVDAPAPSDDVGLNRLAQRVAAANRKWWFAPDGSPLKRNKGELLMLVVTEIAEAFEGERKNLMDDKLPHRRMAEVEIADAIIRLLDYAQAHGYDLDGAYREKMAYNATREDHKREAAQIAAGNGL